MRKEMMNFRTEMDAIKTNKILQMKIIKNKDYV